MRRIITRQLLIITPPLPPLSLRWGCRGALLAFFFLLVLAAPAFAAPADTEYEKGLAYLRAGRAEEALKALSPLAVKKPGDPYIWYHIGLAEYKLDRLDAALDAFEKTAGFAGDGARNFGLGPAFLNLGIGYFKAGDFTKAERCLNRSLGFSPDDGDALYYLGLAKAERGDYEAALEALEGAGEKAAGDPKMAAAVSNGVGAVRYRQEKYGQALTEFSTALAADPDNIEALYYLSLVNYKENGYAAAKPYLDRLAARGSYDEKTAEALFTSFFNIGVDFQNRDKPALAAEMFGKALRIKPDDADARYYRGYNLMALDSFEEACEEFGRALALDPAMSKAKAQAEVAGKFACETASRKAAGALARGEFPESVAAYEKAVSFDPANADAKKGLKEASGALEKETRLRADGVRAMLAGGDYAKARDAADALEKYNPGSSEPKAIRKEIAEKLATVKTGYLAAARDAEKAGALGEAESWYGKALAIDRDDKSAAESLKRVAQKIADERARAKAAAAAKAAEKAAEKPQPPAQPADEDEVRRRYLAGVEHYTRGELSEAITNWREVLRLDPKNEKAMSSIARAEDKLREASEKNR